MKPSTLPILITLALALLGSCTTPKPNHIRFDGAYLTEKKDFYGDSYRYAIRFKPDSTTYQPYFIASMRKFLRRCNVANPTDGYAEHGTFSVRGDSIFVHSTLDQRSGVYHTISENGRVAHIVRNQDERHSKGRMEGKTITLATYSQKRDTTWIETYRFRHF